MSKRPNNKQNGNQNDGIWWLITIGCFCTGALWWAGLILMFLNMSGKLPPLSRKKREQDEQRFESSWGEAVQPNPQPEPGKKKKRRGLAALITGVCIGGVGILQLASTFWEMLKDVILGFWSAGDLAYYLEDGAAGLVLLIAGAITAGVGWSKMRKDKLFRRYQAMVAGRGAVSIHAMADALNVSYAKACKQLQEMIDSGWFGASAYIDLNRGRLMLDGTGLDYEEPEPEPEPTPEQTISEEEKILRQIRADNDLIDNPEISRKIDRIEELTRKIFSYIREKPEKAGELRSFLNYYLPQTLKILETYARLEAQGVEGDNITAAKQRIEGMMDTLVGSYERQLDKLFEGDVLDITTDIEVMEAMLARDGLTADELLKKTK